MYMGKINLYFSIVKYDDMPIEMKYLNIVQALETYHVNCTPCQGHFELV